MTTDSTVRPWYEVLLDGLSGPRSLRPLATPQQVSNAIASGKITGLPESLLVWEALRHHGEQVGGTLYLHHNKSGEPDRASPALAAAAMNYSCRQYERLVVSGSISVLKVGRAHEALLEGQLATAVQQYVKNAVLDYLHAAGYDNGAQ